MDAKLIANGPPPRGERNPAAIPHSTYRLQFTPTFRFDDARAIVPYLAELGIGTIYASPYFEARPGSEHGYDVVNPNALNPEIGTAAEHADFIAVAQRAGLGHLLDFVPNHMGIGVVNPRWLDVLAWGEGSPSANFFDINWRPLQREMWGRVLVPSLGDYYNRVLERGELSLEFDPEAGTIAVAYFDDRFPLAPTSYPAVLEIAATLRSGSAWALRALAAEFGSASREEAIALQAGLADAARDAGDRAAIEAALATFRVDADAAAIDRLDALLQAQHYRLAYWRVSADEINYRRFFDVNDLAGVRVEDAEVLGRTHVLVFDLIARGIVQGLRIDHVDGLFNPSGYCRFLRDRGETLDHPQYLLVEKILARDETLHTDWGVDGTTGYDFMAQVAGLFVDGAAEAEFDRIYRRFAGVSGSFAQFAYRAKKDIMQISLASELEVLSTLLYELAQLDRRSKDFTYNVLRDALVEIVASFPVYRTYVTSEDVSPLGRHYIDAALEAGFVRSELGEARVFEFIESLLTVHAPEISPNYPGRDVLRFAMKFQQYTSPVMAKSVEDTAFYRYVRLVALNEVGGDPAFFGTSVAAFHQANAARATDFPHTMLATATHDHKRGEDTRLRIAALSEMPALWGRAIRRWTTLNLRHKSNIDAGLGPSDNDEYFIYQILIGTWPVAWLDATTLDANERDAYVARLTAYFEKALREAKFRTSWFNPSEPYETAVKGFVEAIVPADEPTPFIRELQALARLRANRSRLQPRAARLEADESGHARYLSGLRVLGSLARRSGQPATRRLRRTSRRDRNDGGARRARRARTARGRATRELARRPRQALRALAPAASAARARGDVPQRRLRAPGDRGCGRRSPRRLRSSGRRHRRAAARAPRARRLGRAAGALLRRARAAARERRRTLRRSALGPRDHRGSGRGRAVSRGERPLRNAPRRGARAGLIVALVEVEVRAVFGIVEHLTRLREDRRRKIVDLVDRALGNEEIRFGPLLPRLERLVVDLEREADAEALLEVQSRDEDARAAREVRAVFPERAVARLIPFADSQRVDVPEAPRS